METKQATRKPFPVTVVQVNLKNIEEVAEWCKGSIVQRPMRMLGTTTELPVILLKVQVNNVLKDFEATLGCWIVELKGSFRVYKPAVFEDMFDILDEEDVQISEEGTPELLQKAEEYADRSNGIEGEQPLFITHDEAV